jgi:hypothetical protein
MLPRRSSSLRSRSLPGPSTAANATRHLPTLSSRWRSRKGRSATQRYATRGPSRRCEGAARRGGYDRDRAKRRRLLHERPAWSPCVRNEDKECHDGEPRAPLSCGCGRGWAQSRRRCGRGWAQSRRGCGQRWVQMWQGCRDRRAADSRCISITTPSRSSSCRWRAAAAARPQFCRSRRPRGPLPLRGTANTQRALPLLSATPGALARTRAPGRGSAGMVCAARTAALLPLRSGQGGAVWFAFTRRRRRNLLTSGAGACGRSNGDRPTLGYRSGWDLLGLCEMVPMTMTRVPDVLCNIKGVRTRELS